MVESNEQFEWLVSDSHESEDFKAGDVIFKEGDFGIHMYVVREGTVEINVHGEMVETVGHGGVFGEMALIDGSPRSATATAKTDCKLLAVDQRKFTFFVHETPFFALNVMHTLARRLRETNAKL